VGLDRVRIVSPPERELRRENRQAVEWIDDPVHELDCEAAIVLRRPDNDDRQGDENEDREREFVHLVISSSGHLMDLVIGWIWSFELVISGIWSSWRTGQLVIAQR
jgi:hypothetical protein